MSGSRRVAVCMPEALIAGVDGVACDLRLPRSQVLRDAAAAYVERHRRRHQLRERLREGYQAMGSLNLSLAEEGLVDGYVGETGTARAGGGRRRRAPRGGR